MASLEGWVPRAVSLLVSAESGARCAFDVPQAPGGIRLAVDPRPPPPAPPEGRAVPRAAEVEAMHTNSAPDGNDLTEAGGDQTFRRGCRRRPAVPRPVQL
jgi:hypothetical protein